MLTLPNPARTRRRRLGGAFTLIELIVVVIIIAVLAAIAGVAYNQFVSDARDTAVLANAKQIDTALTARSAHDDQTPVAIVTANAGTMLAHLQVTAGEHLTTTAYPTAAAPTAVQVTDGTRYACLTLGTEVGQASTITLGPCGAGGTPEPDPVPSPDPTPTPDPGPVAWSSATAGLTHTCAIKPGGSAWCWGNDGNGQLGNGATTGDQATPVQVAGVGTWTFLTAGNNHTCGIQTDRSAWCWGYDGNGQLGNGATTGDQATPVQVTGGGTWTSLTARLTHTCGIKTDGTAWCWGNDTASQLGNGTTTGDQATPVQVTGTGTWASLTAGDKHTCGIKTDGTAWCWGNDTYSQLGNGAGGSQHSPAQVVGTGTWTSLTAGVNYTCGIKTDRSAWCWGNDGNGQLGNGTASADQISPVQVSGASTWTSLTAGDAHTCGIKTDGTAWCWGYGTYGRLGNGATVDQKDPVAVSGGGAGAGAWTSLTAGSRHTCGIKTGGTTWCWGYASYGRLGNGTVSGNQASPVQVVEPAV